MSASKTHQQGHDRRTYGDVPVPVEYRRTSDVDVCRSGGRRVDRLQRNDDRRRVHAGLLRDAGHWLPGHGSGSTAVCRSVSVY